MVSFFYIYVGTWLPPFRRKCPMRGPGAVNRCKTNDMKSRSVIILLFAALLMIGDGCASSRNHKNKKLKPGKPIPCPLKDC